MRFALRILFAAFMTIAALTVTPRDANAQIPVTDVASIWTEIAHHGETLLQWKAQFDEWRAQYEALNGTWNELTAGELSIGQILALRGTFPPELDEFMAYGDAIVGALRGDYDRLRAAASTLPDDFFPADSVLRQQLETTLSGIAGAQAAADNIYRSSQKNVQTGADLQSQMGAADTLIKATSLNTRTNIELLGVMSEANRIAAIQMRQDADRLRADQKAREDLVRASQRVHPPIRYGP